MQPSDLNSDGVVDVIDLSILVSRWGSSDATADINSDGIVDALDLSVLVSNWGAVSSAYTALLVTADGTLNAGATALRNILSDEGYSVVVRGLSEPEDYSGIDVVVMSYGNPTGGDNGTYVHPPVGIVGVDTWRPIGMASNLGFENNTNPVEVVDAASPLAAGVTGTFNAYVSPAYITWTTDLSASPDVVVTRPSQPTQAVVFAYEAGTTMPGRYATTRHVALGYHLDGFAVGISSEARAQLLAALSWARSSTYVAPPPPGAPTNLNATAGDMQVSLSWNSVAGATSYSVKRSTTSGGPYSTIVSGHTTTSYIDSSLTNGSTYYYVVSASNAEGESANSSQVSAVPVEGGATAERLSLHVTTEELTIWRDRWNNGVSGDAFLNTRVSEEKSRLTSHADTVAGNINGHLWDIPSMTTDSAGRFNSQPSPSMSTARNQAGRLLNAAFAALLTQNATRMNQIGSILHQQPDRTRCNFATNPGWAYGVQQMKDASVPGFEISHAVIQHLHTYTYHQAAVLEGWATALTSTQNTKLRNWYKAWADYNLAGLEDRLNARFSGGWASGNYSSFGTGTCTWCGTTVAYTGGPTVYGLQDSFNNRAMRTVAAFGLAGILLNDAHLKERAWRATRDFLVYSFWPHGAICDNHRASSSERWPQHYMTMNLSHSLPFVDALARTGDASLYQLETTSGALGTQGAPSSHGNPESHKSFLFAIRAMARYGNQSYNRWHGSQRLNFRGPFTTNLVGKGSTGAHDSWIYTNIYYRDAGLPRDWYRGINGQPAWEIHGNGTHDLNDSWAFPAPYLMWAGLEGQVWPYPGVPQP
jgi:hypothetical protein